MGGFAFPGQAFVTAGGRRVIAGGGGSLAKTYADFQVHIATLATGGVKPWSNPTTLSAGAFRTTAAAPASDMFGSSWLQWVSSFCPASRMIQHGLPSQVAFDDQVSGGRDIYYRLDANGVQTVFNSVGRNGYTSLAAAGGGEAAFIMTDLIRWDDALKKAFRSNPSAGGAETEYTW